MTTLDLADIQGNIPRAYGRFNYPVARYFFLNIRDAAGGRRVVEALRRRVTTAAPWGPEKPPVTLNLGFSFFGLYALDLPTRTLQAFPFEFIEGMKKRAHILGDMDPTRPAKAQPDWADAWDPIWRESRYGTGDEVHVWISMNAQVAPGTEDPVPELEQRTQWLRDLCAETPGVTLMRGHGRDGAGDFQAATALFATGPDGRRWPTPLEHFGFTDGIGDPIFAGQMDEATMKARLPGRGKWMSRKRGWQPLATGEFLLGHPDEAQELPPTAPPDLLMRNGSFMAFRKLHQNVASWRRYFAEQAKTHARVNNVPVEEAAVTLTSKAMGRWPDGIPLARAGTHAAWLAERARLGFDDPEKGGENRRAYLRSAEASDFRYGHDLSGHDAPNTCHLRRVNTRDYLDPLNDPAGENPDATTQLNKRRRILRRGLPYGASDLEAGDDDTEQGVAMMVVCASLFRQFEFVQQQWIQYGLDFNAGNHTCPVVGDHRAHDRFVIPARPESGKPPFICANMPTFVETRGGEYFFIPSMTALRMIAMGTVDPT
jgi:deferrochelatase/peroxidase EfeB